MKKILLVLLLVALVVAFFAFDLQQFLTLNNLKAGMAQFEAWRAEQPVLVGAVYFAVYVVVTALSLPGAVIMTLAGGALFGLFWGVVLVSFASTIGATLAFLVARYLLRDTVQRRFGRRLQALNKGVEKEGAFYLFTLRLVPVFPFFVINLLMGLTPMPARTFYWVSQVGMLAGTVVYVNAGTQLAQVNALGDIMSPSLLGSFALLGVFPLVTKKILAWIRRRKQRAQYTPPKKYDRNLIVIGAGAGGLVSDYI
ncbi:MAG TPA: pyridine nucleotide-disulfide oxidoreductase, partial [Pusillimonas sp.]|nr:pyridine nucleotide-disulfide oxidoreductase [Pusillimonas sp.]